MIDSTKARVAFLSPVAHANLGRPLPDPAGHNRDLARYRDVIKRVAKAAFGAVCRPVRRFRHDVCDVAEHRTRSRQAAHATMASI